MIVFSLYGFPRAINPHVLFDCHDEMRNFVTLIRSPHLTFRTVCIICIRDHCKQRSEDELFVFASWHFEQRLRKRLRDRIAKEVIRAVRVHFPCMPVVKCVFISRDGSYGFEYIDVLP